MRQACRVELDPKPYLLFNNALEQQMPLKSGQPDWLYIGNPIGLRSRGGATASGRVYTTWCSEDGDRTTNAVEWALATTTTD